MPDLSKEHRRHSHRGKDGWEMKMQSGRILATDINQMHTDESKSVVQFFPCIYLCESDFHLWQNFRSADFQMVVVAIVNGAAGPDVRK
jgi:hypothetical protein